MSVCPHSFHKIYREGQCKAKTSFATYLKEPGVCHLGHLDDGLPGAARRHRRPDGDGLLRRALRLGAELT